MSDLFNLVKQSKLNQQNKFWGHYDYLNNPAGNVDSESLFKLQVARLKILENNNIQLQNANKFLSELKKINPNQILEQIEEFSENQIYARIMELMNSGLISSQLNPTNRALNKNSEGKFSGGYREGSSLETIRQEENAIINELTTLLNIINYANADQLTTNLIQAFRGGKKFGNEPAGRMFSTYALYKADEAENLMVHALSQNTGWRAIQTGTFYNKSQQLLEDVFAFDDIGYNIEFDENLSFTIKQGNNTKVVNVKSINAFFAEYEKLTGDYAIHLSDELYEKFQQLSILSGQAKSGKDLQALINSRAKTRNAISLNDLGPTSSLIGLYQLYQKEWIDENNSSETLIAITNYCLSKSIALTNITGNQIYFTRDGFITATKWMELYHQMLKFNPSIAKVSNNLLDKKNPYAFVSV